MSSKGSKEDAALVSNRIRQRDYREENERYSHEDFWARNPPSFALFGRIPNSNGEKEEVKEVAALVNIINGYGTYDKLKDRTNHYRSVCYLVKGRLYSLLIVPSFFIDGRDPNDQQRNVKHSNNLSNIKLSNLKYCDTVKGFHRSLSLSFHNHDRIDIQFKFQEHFEYFLKVLQVLKEIMIEEEEDDDLDMSLDERRKLVEYKVPESKGISSFLGMCRADEMILEFYDISPIEWVPKTVQQWLNHIYFQDGREAVTTFYNYLCSQTVPDPEIDQNLQSKKKKLKMVNLWELIDRYIMRSKTIFNIEREMKNFERFKDESQCDPTIFPLISHPEIRKRWSKEMNRMRFYGGRDTPMFNMPFALVLKKRVERIDDWEDTSLRQVENDIQIRHRMWWDPVEMRDHILSLLLFRKELKDVVEDYNKKFIEYEKECIKDFYRERIEVEGEGGGEGVDDTISDMIFTPPKSTEIDPKLWVGILKKFREKEKVEIDLMSFVVHMKGRQNLLRIEKHKVLKKSENNEIERKRLIDVKRGVCVQIDQQEKRIEKLMDHMFECMEKKPDMVPRIENMITETELKVKKLKDEEARIGEKIQILETKIKEVDLPKILEEWDRRIKDCVPGMNMALRDPFLSSPMRRRSIQRFLRETIERKAMVGGMTEFVAKLVLSIRNGDVPKKWHVNALKVIDPFLKPGFFKWGFLHGSCLLSNMGIHWFNNSICFVSQLAMGEQYQEVICIDANCPLIINFKTIYEKITQLAFEIVYANINWKYATYNLWGGGKDGVSKNCQEFTRDLLESLDSTTFFPEVRSYLELIKEKMSKGGEQKSANDLRFLRIEKRFEEKFEEILTKGKYKMVKENRGKLVYFKSHSDLDNFYVLCTNIDPFFNLNYPGVCQLLKGFDRAYWMRLGGNPDQDELKPGIRCPMK